MAHDHALVIRITGDSGDGVQLVGEQLTITAALSGKDVRTLPDFPAEIRAPVGTIAGVSGFQLAMADKAIFTAGETLDVLVALNPAALKHSIAFLDAGGLLFINEDSFSDKDFQKAGVSATLLDECKANYQLISLPLITHTLKAVAETGLSNTQAKKTKNFYILGIILWLFDLSRTPCQAFIAQKFSRSPELAMANEKALLAGFNYALTLELSRKPFMLNNLTREAGEYRQISGIEALAMGLAAITVNTQIPMLVSGYPITPASGILHECARLSDYGVSLLQAEDEIAAICACLGAAFGGRLALTCTSGPGLDLKSEGLGLAVMAELPLVLVDVQRAGASTGLPTKTGQSDLNQALYGRHGEAPMPVIAAQSPSDCFVTIIEAFRIAVKYMTPVIVLLDAYLANAAEPWCIPDTDQIDYPIIQMNRFEKPFMRDENLARSWNIPGTPGFIHQLGGLEKEGAEGKVSYSSDNYQAMVNCRLEKVARIANDIDPLIIEGNVTSSILVISWGSTYGALKSAIEALQKDENAVAWIHLRHLNPLPHDLAKILKRYDTVLVAELNTGQLCQLLRAKYLVDAQSISLCNGLPFSETFLINAINRYSKIADRLNTGTN